MARKIAVYAVVTSVVHIEGIGAKSVFIITAAQRCISKV